MPAQGGVLATGARINLCTQSRPSSQQRRIMWYVALAAYAIGILCGLTPTAQIYATYARLSLRHLCRRMRTTPRAKSPPPVAHQSSEEEEDSDDEGLPPVKEE